MSDAREALVALILERFRAAETYMDLPRQAGLLADAILALPPGRTETEVKAEAWDEGAQAGLDAGLSIAEAVHANGGVLNLADVPNAPVNPYRAAVRPSGQEQADG